MKILGAGSNPQWNETFLFTVSDSASELKLKIMEKDSYSDDNIGEAMWVKFIFKLQILLYKGAICNFGILNMHSFLCRIPLDAVLDEGSVPESVYKLVKEEQYCGEIRIALTFKPEVIIMMYNLFFYYFYSCFVPIF